MIFPSMGKIGSIISHFRLDEILQNNMLDVQCLVALGWEVFLRPWWKFSLGKKVFVPRERQLVRSVASPANSRADTLS
jgi:hypothetical protein